MSELSRGTVDLAKKENLTSRRFLFFRGYTATANFGRMRCSDDFRKKKLMGRIVKFPNFYFKIRRLIFFLFCKMNQQMQNYLTMYYSAPYSLYKIIKDAHNEC